MISTLTCALYHTATHAVVRERLCREVRTSGTRGQITSETAGNLPYLCAVIEESMRIMSPVPLTLARVSPPGGIEVCGKFIPAGTSIGVAQVAACWSARNFTDPMSFVPERWLANPDARFRDDVRDASRPFSYGPRGCLGK
jgi:cytochrome P450